MPKLYNITNWNPQPWVNTGGTRSKKFIQNPDDGKYYYFKKSFKRGGQDYFFEFWSEIIATEIGLMLGFDVLRYDIAIDGEDMGCISELMITEDETLTEGGSYLQAYDIEFDPKVKAAREFYSFQLIIKTLELFNLSNYIENVIEIIVFDSIIGNGDRHQENWAFINKHSFTSRGLAELEDEIKSGKIGKKPNFFRHLAKTVFDFSKKEMKPEIKFTYLYSQKTKSFAPIFDNGSSLGRELEDEKVNRMLKDQTELLAYINRGVSEIHWNVEVKELLENIYHDISEANPDKIGHITLIKKLLESSYTEMTEKIITRVVERFNSEKIGEIISKIDDSVPGTYNKFKLPENRKELIIKLVTLRIEKLKSILGERV